MNKPFSPSCERNKDAILAVLQQELPQSGALLEIGSGTGQHAVYFAEHFPGIVWHASDRKENHHGISAWIRDAGLANLHGPEDLDVDAAQWPLSAADAVFTANTAHIMGWPSVRNMLCGVGNILVPNGLFAMYGPFKYAGRYTSESNEEFDGRLKAQDPNSAIRDFEAMLEEASKNGLVFVADKEMPANNRLLIWRKQT